MDWIFRIIALIVFLTQCLGLFSALLTAKFNPNRNWLSLWGLALRGILLAYTGMYFYNFQDQGPFILVVVTAVLWIFDVLFLFFPSSWRAFITSRLNYSQDTLIKNRFFFVYGNLFLLFLCLVSLMYLFFTTVPVS
jgi:hypothetical protein